MPIGGTVPLPETGLPDTFTFTQARAAGLTPGRLYRLRDQGRIEQISRGLYHKTDAGWSADIDLIEIAARAPEATICLASALARHGLTDEMPAATDVALPRGTWKPAVGAAVIWHAFAVSTFEVGRETLKLSGGPEIGIYTAPRSIIDAFRLRYREGDIAITALRRWLREPGNHPAELLDLARHFPKARPGLRGALEILLA
jgi:predicted transcriptional regulator of viral defense system